MKFTDAYYIEQKINEHGEHIADIKSGQTSLKMRMDVLKDTVERENKLLDNKIGKIGDRTDEANKKSDELGRDVRDLSHSIRRLEEKIGDLSGSINGINKDKKDRSQQIVTMVFGIAQAVIVAYLVFRFGIG